MHWTHDTAIHEYSWIQHTISPWYVYVELEPLCTWDWEPMTFTLQALSLVEKVESVQVRFTLCLRDPMEYLNARWMQSLHGFLHNIEWIIFHGHLDYFWKSPLGGRPNTNQETMALRTLTPLVYFIISCVRTHMNRNSLKYHLVEGPITYDFTLHLRVSDHTA